MASQPIATGQAAEAATSANNAGTSGATTMEFTEGEKVLCYHGPLLYEAKVLKCKRNHKDGTTSTKGPHYFVHYRGWKNTWDEWVHQTRMLKWEEKNLVHQKKLMAEHRATTGKDDERKHERRSSIHHKEKDPKEKDKDRDGHHLREKGHDKDHHHKEKDKDKDSHGTKDPKMSNKREARVKKATKEEEGYGTELYNWNVAPTKRKTEVKLVIPDILKMVLVDDWEAVTKNGQLVTLPRQPCVDDVLMEFREHIWSLPASSGPSKREENFPQFLIGIKTYFEQALGGNLLYRFERPQYADILRRYAYGPDVPTEQVKTNSKLYGAEHLLRLLVILPSLMLSASMEPSAMNVIREYTNYLLEFLAKGKERFFLTEYEDTSSNYLSIGRVLS